MTPILQATAVAVIALGVGAVTITALNQDIPDLAVPEKEWVPGSALDGLVFYTTDTVRDSSDVMKDELHFNEGMFQSSMCQVYCDFGWSPYQTWTDGDVVHVTVTTACSDAPHTVVWYLKVREDKVELEGTWTTRRWYWTRQLYVTGTGSGTPHPAPES